MAPTIWPECTPPFHLFSSLLFTPEIDYQLTTPSVTHLNSLTITKSRPSLQIGIWGLTKQSKKEKERKEKFKEDFFSFLYLLTSWKLFFVFLLFRVFTDKVFAPHFTQHGWNSYIHFFLKKKKFSRISSIASRRCVLSTRSHNFNAL